MAGVLEKGRRAVSAMPAVADPVAPTLTMIPVEHLTLGLDFRLDDDPQALAELTASIADLGVLSPLVVRPAGDGFEVMAGRRRLAAARLAELDTVPCIVRHIDDEAAADIALAENMHRRDLSPLEQGLAFARLRDRGLNHTQIAAHVGRHQTTVSLLLRVLELPAELRDRVHRREIGVTTAIDLNGRGTARGHRGGVGTKSVLTGADAGLITHWRRRHDRLLVGIHTILKTHPATTGEYRTLMNRLFALDKQPLPEEVAR